VVGRIEGLEGNKSAYHRARLKRGKQEATGQSKQAFSASSCAVARQDELERVKENNCVPIMGYGLTC